MRKLLTNFARTIGPKDPMYLDACLVKISYGGGIMPNLDEARMLLGDENLTEEELDKAISDAIANVWGDFVDFVFEKNKEKLEDMVSKVYDIEAFYDDISKTLGEGNDFLEIAAHYTKSGNTKILNFK